MSDPIDGFYSAYFTSREGELGAALVACVRGKIVGADAMGARLDGMYEKSEAGYRVRLGVVVPPGTQLVQGGAAGETGASYGIEFSFREKPDEIPFIRIETPMGPLNVKFVKLRDYDV